MTKKKAKPDPLRDLLEWMADRSTSFVVTCGTDEDPIASDEAFDRVRTNWLNAGCPGFKKVPPKPAPPTVRVRIAVVQRGDEARALGGQRPRNTSANDADLVAMCRETLNDDGVEGQESVSFVECDVPAPPEPKTWEGECVL